MGLAEHLVQAVLREHQVRAEVQVQVVLQVLVELMDSQPVWFITSIEIYPIKVPVVHHIMI
jgi:hypothetical protein